MIENSVWIDDRVIQNPVLPQNTATHYTLHMHQTHLLISYVRDTPNCTISRIPTKNNSASILTLSGPTVVHAQAWTDTQLSFFIPGLYLVTQYQA